MNTLEQLFSDFSHTFGLAKENRRDCLSDSQVRSFKMYYRNDSDRRKESLISKVERKTGELITPDALIEISNWLDEVQHERAI